MKIPNLFHMPRKHAPQTSGDKQTAVNLDRVDTRDSRNDCKSRSPSVDSCASTTASVICSSHHRDPRMDQECPYCFKDLAEEPITLLTSGTCQHFVHSQCWKQIGEIEGTEPECPRCAAFVTNAVPLPDARRDPVSWFNAIDVAHKGRLRPQEIMPALIACTAADPAEFGEFRSASKSPSRSTKTLTAQDCKGLVERLRDRSREREVVPDIMRQREWFEYFDVDRNGRLTQDVAMRALLKTFRCHNTARLRSAILSIWPDFDIEGSHSIDRKTMLQQKTGLVDVALAKYSALSVENRRPSGDLGSSPLGKSWHGSFDLSAQDKTDKTVYRRTMSSGTLKNCCTVSL